MTTSEPVTLVITHTLQPQQQEAYERWLRRIMPVAEQFEGHRGVNVIRPSGEGHIYTILIRFDTLENLTRWTASAERKSLLADAEPLLDGGDRIEVQAGSQFWFTPPQQGVRRPARWKQYVLTLAVIFPSAELVPRFWNLIVPSLSGTLAGHLLNDATVVALVVFFWMPWLTRALAGWLKR
ncbi:antibiotic biosynthesis monooxygenase [Chimaeribacter coloradensis]|uniref:Antibiotic biosynthesis monooxygenase n=1 Tax=Chimaeribacter coloradensis TaxID=2060068 RepID=A0A2N5E7T3_9GAMM|nr:antibiotic biosynthesis monooxygenase [Chimaeribacter coloradensis]PLR37543.1 antibiotic biosynthesis monooxygenase [Chimaeribacter coloradensis]